MPAQYWDAPLSQPTAMATAGTALASSVALTDISPLPQATTVGGQLYSGEKFKVTAFGVFSTTGTPTLLIGLYYNAVALCTGGAITTGSTVTNVPWRIDVVGHVRSVGSSGTIMCNGILHMGTSVSAWSVLPMPNTANTSPVTIDTTIAATVSVKAQWGTSSASNTITCHGCEVVL